MEYAPFQEVASRFSQVPPEEFIRSVVFIAPSGKVFSGAQAVFRTLAYAPGHGWMLWMYERIPAAGSLCEWFYCFVAGHRAFFSRLVRILWGKQVEPPSYILTRWVFLRLLGVIYLIAFVSLWRQLAGLIGSRGILPAAEFLRFVKSSLGPERYWLLPTLAWVSPSDGFLKFLALGGAVGSLLLIAGVATMPVLAILWLSYLSLATVGQVFLQFQWDALLLETGFLATLFAPWQLWPRRSCETRPSSLVLWLFRLLLFRLIFSSGAMKLLSGDPTWRNLTALSFHYETQPLPTPLGWYMHQLPLWFHKLSVAVTFSIELGVPFLIFSPRRLRFFAAFSLIFLQILIALTGNYTFFSLLTVALCLLLLDDQALRRCLGWKRMKATDQAGDFRSETRARRWIVTTLGVLILLGGLLQVGTMFLGGRWGQRIPRWFQAPHIVNHYGLFAVMTTSRPEIVVEGSNDGQTWLVYEFKYKPGDIMRPPPWVAPHQPRLDWQLWFAALRSYQQNPWFANFMLRVLEGSPEVLALLDRNPFPGGPPRYVRALLYEYHFTGLAEKCAHGAWWRRELKGLYFPVVTLRR